MMLYFVGLAWVDIRLSFNPQVVGITNCQYGAHVVGILTERQCRSFLTAGWNMVVALIGFFCWFVYPDPV